MYINNQQFSNEIYKSLQNGELTDGAYDSLKHIVNLVCNRYYPHPTYIDRCARAFMISEAEKQLKNFNPGYNTKPSTPFNYFSEVTKNAIIKFFNILFIVI